MKGDIYYLKDKTGSYTHRFEVDTDDNSLMGVCYIEDSEDSFVADVYCKWSACTHWRFNGHDYYPGSASEPDPYYHLCGGYSFMEHITAMCFVWKLAEQINANIHPNLTDDVHESYNDHDRIKKLIETVLDGYEIVKGAS